MKEQFLSLVASWLGVFKKDIRGKVSDFLAETGAEPRDLANMIDIPIEDVYKILEGRGEKISVESFGKILLASGFAVRIEPIENSCLGRYDNVNPELMHECQHRQREAQPNPFTRHTSTQCPHFNGGIPTPPPGFDPSEIPSFVRERMERDAHRMMHDKYLREEREAQHNQSPFRNKTRQELVDIIKKHLWDSEIDTFGATFDTLASFLEEKDKQKKAYERTREEERHIDPSVRDFTERLKKSVKENPNLRDYVKKFLGELEEN